MAQGSVQSVVLPKCLVVVLLHVCPDASYIASSQHEVRSRRTGAKYRRSLECRCWGWTVHRALLFSVCTLSRGY